MAEARRELSKTSFAKTFVLPGLLIFLVPVISYFFFLYAQSSYDADMRVAAPAWKLMAERVSDPEPGMH